MEIDAVLTDLKAFKVPALILSGGEPLLHPHLFEIARRAKELGLYLGLSSNGTLIDADLAAKIAAVGFDYVGISLDGLEATHDRFRRKAGAFAASLAAIRHCRAVGIKVGLRYTLTQDTAPDFPALLTLMEAEDCDKFYLSHLNYAGRGYRNRKHDAHFQTTRTALEHLFAHAWAQLQRGVVKEYVTGNNDADAVFLLRWVERRWPTRAIALRQRLLAWGGNSAGVNIANIDNLGNVHPDTMWWDYTLGNVRTRPFSQIWQDVTNPLMAGLKARPRPLQGRCIACAEQAICNGNSRVRAWRLTGDFWAEDPGCYLDDAEIGLNASSVGDARVCSA
jgi:heme d1 biosynthesis radical SAM protein NirJ